ncbi:uncharacterized protein At1g76070 [Punica granatum]|uniref:Syringolide-induced protein 14-1-1 n=2 Tax=Punica granatum TaxID=22663 RepID=A0A218X8B3_PUNGR|nr:uncharacterized protein At1g76070 [Punica granatum]OWM80950.1 hypothetical protein CDL15_Pgr006981 [Punica granatum]PKI45621.1 hypothetical protein CRG98_033937 [Punica granatum]
MEKDKQSKPNKRSITSSKLLKLLPRAAASAVSFQNPPFSPGRSSENHNNNKTHHRNHSHVGKGFSGPLMVSIIPDEARRRTKRNEELDFGAPEPVSPKVSCMGQIKHKKNKIKKKKSEPEVDKSRSKRPSPPKKQSSAIRRIFGGGKQRRAGEKSTGSSADVAPELARLPDRGPALGHMRRFASGREAFAGFDWSEVQVAPADSEQRDHREAGEEEEDEEDEEVMIPFSAPILVGRGGGVGEVGDGDGHGGMNLQPRKEINLWKRRTMAPPRLLQLHP